MGNGKLGVSARTEVDERWAGVNRAGVWVCLGRGIARHCFSVRIAFFEIIVEGRGLVGGAVLE